MSRANDSSGRSAHALEQLEPLATRMTSTGLAGVAATIGTLFLLGLVLIAGIAMRTSHLGQVPAGFNQDEACNGYDAECLLRTGRDQHGNRFPVLIQAFNDYRMPLFDYSLIVPVAVLGLRPAVVRLGAALWGCADLLALALLAGLLIGLRGAVIAAALMAFSPWHLPLSRMGHEAITASATVTLAMACLFLAIRRQRGRWLLAAGLFLGAALYSYAITKAFVPLIMLWVGLVYWRQLAPMRRHALGAAALALLSAIPQALALWRHPALTMARYHSMAPGTVLNQDWPHTALTVIHSLALSFAPGFLFLRGSPWVALHPPGFGQLLAAQVAMLGLAVCALSEARYRRPAVFCLGWLLLGALPGALILPRFHPQHLILAVTPFMLLSALGMVFLFDYRGLSAAARAVYALLVLIVAMVQAVRFAIFYFTLYPPLAAYQFQYGLGPAVQWIARARPGGPVVISDRINQPYIYVLFFTDYPPARFQHQAHDQAPDLFAPVRHFDRYYFVDPAPAYASLPRGAFLFTGYQDTPAPPAAVVQGFAGAPGYEGYPAYKILLK